MERRFQKYRDKIRLLYMYVREAHPNPRSAPCGSTEDLGWNHQSGNTRSAKERAQRARWLNNDLKLNFPWIIDDVDNEMFWDYWPSGFYVGWLIDCDGTTLLHEPWGWATSRTQWCGLPLADFDELDAYLDAYLADPPACYRGVQPPAHVSLIPAVAHQPGNLGTEWVSDLVLTNAENAAVTATVSKFDRGEEKTTTAGQDLTLEPGESLLIRDVLTTLFQTGGAATIAIHGSRGLMAVGRTYNDVADGTYGQFVPGLDVTSNSVLKGGEVGHLLMLEESGADGRRTNLGLVNTISVPVDVKIDFFDEQGNLLGSLEKLVPANGYLQFNRVLKLVSGSGLRNVRAEVNVLSRNRGIIAFASSIDNRTGDPVTQIAWASEEN